MSPLPDSSSSSPTMTVHSKTLKVKRKCGRPRNPIPRHKRESHISAEHRRREKIQNGFETLKNIVPHTGEILVMRDSKADILFKAVDHSKKLQAEYNEQNKMINELQDEIQSLKTAIDWHQKLISSEKLEEENKITMEERFEEYIQERSKKNWKFWIFSLFIRPLFESYNSNVTQNTLQNFMTSVLDWATRKLSLATLRTVFGSFLTTSSETSLMSGIPSLREESLTSMQLPTDESCLSMDNVYPEKDLALTNRDVSLNSLASEDPMLGSLPGIDVLLGSDVSTDLPLSTLDLKDLAFDSIFTKDFPLGPSCCKNINDLSLGSLTDKDFNLGTFVLDEPIYTLL